MKTKIGKFGLGIAVVLITTVSIFAQSKQKDNHSQKDNATMEMQNQPMMMNMMRNMPGDTVHNKMMQNCMNMMNNSSMMKRDMINGINSMKGDSTRQSMMKNCMGMMNNSSMMNEKMNKMGSDEMNMNR